MRDRAIWVIKLGGSLGGGPWLSRWLDMLASHGGGRVVVVPGGGRFADEVRRAQADWGFGDVAAHNMAVLAMAQYAEALRARCPALAAVADEAAIAAALCGGRVALWRPLDALRETAGTLTRWEVTSDSLAAGLAARLGASRLVVVKACAVPPTQSPAELAAAGIVDPAFAEAVAGARYVVDVVAKDALGGIERDLVAATAAR